MGKEDMRRLSDISAVVDAAIQQYEEGKIEDALRVLSMIGFRASEINRILKHPDKRRTYINDMLSGF